MAAGDEERQPGALDVEAGHMQGDPQIQAVSAGGLHQRQTNAPDDAIASTAGDSQVEDPKPGASGNLSEKAGGASEAASEEPFVTNSATYTEIAKYFGILGWTAFGGPAAHIAMFQKVRAVKRQAVVAFSCPVWHGINGHKFWSCAWDGLAQPSMGMALVSVCVCLFAVTCSASALHPAAPCRLRLRAQSTARLWPGDPIPPPAAVCGSVALVHLPCVYGAAHAGAVHARLVGAARIAREGPCLPPPGCPPCQHAGRQQWRWYDAVGAATGEPIPTCMCHLAFLCDSSATLRSSATCPEGIRTCTTTVRALKASLACTFCQPPTAAQVPHPLRWALPSVC